MRAGIMQRAPHAVLVAVAVLTAMGGPAAAAPLVMYSTGFTSTEGYVPGFSLAGQQGWVVQQAGFGNGSALVTDTPPGPPDNQAVVLVTGTGENPGPLYAVPPIYSGTFASAVSQGYTTLVSQLFMYLPSGQASTATIGSLIVDTTSEKVLAGFWVRADTGVVTLVGNYDDGGTIGNAAFSTGTQLGFDDWVNVVTLWDRSTGEFGVAWGGTNLFTLPGAAAGADAQVSLLYADWGAGADQAFAYFDELEVTAVPEPATGLLSAGAACMLSGALWRRRGRRVAGGSCPVAA